MIPKLVEETMNLSNKYLLSYLYYIDQILSYIQYFIFIIDVMKYKIQLFYELLV